MDGTVVTIGVPDPDVTVDLNVQQLALSDKKLTGCFYDGGRPHHDAPRYVEMYRRGQLKLDELITTKYDITEVNEAVADLHAGVNARGVFRLGRHELKHVDFGRRDVVLVPQPRRRTCGDSVRNGCMIAADAFSEGS